MWTILSCWIFRAHKREKDWQIGMLPGFHGDGTSHNETRRPAAAARHEQVVTGTNAKMFQGVRRHGNFPLLQPDPAEQLPSTFNNAALLAFEGCQFGPRFEDGRDGKWSGMSVPSYNKRSPRVPDSLIQMCFNP